MNNSITDLECLDKINVSLPNSLVTVFSADILELLGDVWPFNSLLILSCVYLSCRQYKPGYGSVAGD